jgi:drug/metabolite transporter (DMT)-like permease
MVKLFYSRLSAEKGEERNIKSIAYASTIFAAFLWGTSFIVVELGLELINAFWFALLRFVAASAGALVVVLILNKRIERSLFLVAGSG